ncbi:MAG: Na(+)-translocating NADH-quinone reductase subunit A [Muribaculum sp.]|nr:Na(+)-translocating NADH-quinone reductase subunit A [Muribaculaceae bacterium]MCM1080670.1 Na(+)-translocating NADH-quinone reductase subunit A [Muribaculum sp.]
MTKIVTLKKGLDLKLAGAITDNAKERDIQASLVAIVPDDFPGVVPKVLVKAGDLVEKGTPLFCDKTFTDIKVVSPVSGKVVEVARGERRKLLYISVESGHNDTTSASAIPANDKAPDDAVKTEQRLLDSGIWSFIRQMPYGIVPRPSVRPRDIMVTCFDSSPLAPSWDKTAVDNADYIRHAVAALKKLTDGKVYLGVRNNWSIEVPEAEIVVFNGPHPAGNASVQIANIAPVNKGDVVWTLDLPTLIRIGKLVFDSVLDYSTIVAVTGCCVKHPEQIRTVIGAPLADILQNQIADTHTHVRIIAGNVLTGIKSPADSQLRFPYTQVTVIPEGDDKVEFMGWASLSRNKMSESCSFPSKFLKKKFCPDARLNGGRRAMIMSGIYDKYLPMDIMVEFLVKACLAKDIDLMEQLGIYEILPADVALCEYADPSKLELQKIIREGIEFVFHELS